ncbi:MAG: hypothetical protein LBV12_08220 [Puniceicoccales bacterium]|jgi:hypothetical protein|nr:hypothetical protein [Puniceicoccales bacterium]
MKIAFLTLFVAAAAFSPAIAQTQSPAATQQGSGSTQSTGGIEAGTVTGTAWAVTPDGNQVQIQPGQKIPANAQISTDSGSALELFFSNGATVVLQPNTRIQIPVFTQNPNGVPASGYDKISREPSSSRLQIVVVSGSAIIDGARLNPLSSLEARTPVFSAVSQGGVLAVVSDGPNSSIGAISGGAEVRQLNSLAAPVSLGVGDRVAANTTANATGATSTQVTTSKIPAGEQLALVDLLQNGGVSPAAAPMDGSGPPALVNPNAGIVVDNSVAGDIPNLSPNGEGQAV